jgi:hypothetical protein
MALRLSGAAVAILMASSVTASPSNGTRPESSSKRMTPSDQMSVRESTCFDACICSGDIYRGDPTSALVRVMLTSGFEPAFAVTFEIPKSSTLTERRPSARRIQKRFAGLRSR